MNNNSNLFQFGFKKLSQEEIQEKNAQRSAAHDPIKMIKHQEA
jgi:hypothetical protein